METPNIIDISECIEILSELNQKNSVNIVKASAYGFKKLTIDNFINDGIDLNRALSRLYDVLTRGVNNG